MSNKVFVGLVLITEIAICSLVILFFYVNMANDLTEKVTILERENQELRELINSEE